MNSIRPSARLTRRLPIAIAAVLMLVIAGVSWAAYAQIRRAVLDASAAHLAAAGREVASLLETSLRRASRDLADSVAAHGVSSAALDSLRGHSGQVLAVGLWDRTGALVASSGSAALAKASGHRLATTAGRSSLVAGSLVVEHDTLAYAVGAPVLGPGRDTAGYVTATHGLGASSGGETIGKLIGKDARLLVGDNQGGVWTNLSRAVEGPPQSVNEQSETTRIGVDGREYVGVAAAVRGSPWLVWVDTPADTALATARNFLAELVGIGLLFAIAGGIAVWYIVRRAVLPLDHLRNAAELLSAGVTPDPVIVRRDDEIGGLARTFNSMSGRVRLAAAQLADHAKDLERRNLELRESETRYRQLVEQSPDAVIVHRDSRIVFANGVAAAMVGAPGADSLIGTSILDLIDPEDREAAERRSLAIAESGERSSPTEIRLRTLAGEKVIAEVNGMRILFDGTPAIQTLARDVTERHLLEEQLRQSQKMEAVGRLAGGIAHDFNNLLTIINTYAELTLAGMSAGDPKRADIEDIRRAAVSAAHLTRQMLAFSRKQVLAPRMLDVNEAIAGMSGMLERVLGEHVEVITQLTADLGPIWADAGQLEQVLLNLAVNARDAMPQGGTLRIETAERALDEGTDGHRHIIPSGRYVMLSVSDTGVGMTEEVKAQIFEPFFTTKGVGEGTGLGLSTVYGIVKQSGGYIWVYSEPGRGSIFKLFFPLYAGSETGVPQATGEYQIPTADAANILLVEDDTRVRQAVRRILERSPHTIFEAASAPDAIALFNGRQGRIDLVVTDMVMPSMTGGELIRELRERNPQLRAIIMSGYSEEATTREWRLPPNSVFVEKPISPSRMLRCVAEALGGVGV